MRQIEKTRMSQMKRKQHAGGFTLIEIMMVVAILGLTLTMGIPRFGHALRKEGMGKFEYELAQACRDARQAAILGNHDAQITIRLKDRTFTDPGGSGTKIIPDNVAIDAVGLNDIEMRDADEVVVTFMPKGECDDFAIVYRSPEGAIRKLSVDPVTALVDIQAIR